MIDLLLLIAIGPWVALVAYMGTALLLDLIRERNKDNG